MAEKYLTLDLDDPRAEEIAEIMANKSAKKIVGVLAEKQMTEGDIAKVLGMPLNSVEYNLKKLISVGLVEKTSEFFWSTRGKKIPVYKVAERKILISPRTSGFKGIVPAVLISGAVALGIWKFGIGESTEIVQDYAMPVADKAMVVVGEGARAAAGATNLLYPNVPLWFLFGALSAIFIFLLWNWRKIWK